MGPHRSLVRSLGSHRFDPLSAALGILAVTAGLLVALGEALDLQTGGPWWAVAAALVGLAIIPWRRRLADGDPDAAPDDDA